MSSLLEKIMPRDVIALVLIVGGLYLKAIGVDGTISMILVGIAVFYFGAEIMKQKPRVENG